MCVCAGAKRPGGVGPSVDERMRTLWTQLVVLGVVDGHLRWWLIVRLNDVQWIRLTEGDNEGVNDARDPGETSEQKRETQVGTAAFHHQNGKGRKEEGEDKATEATLASHRGGRWVEVGGRWVLLGRMGREKDI